MISDHATRARPPGNSGLVGRDSVEPDAEWYGLVRLDRVLPYQIKVSSVDPRPWEEGWNFSVAALLSCMPYVELHACSAFSFLRGGSFPEQLAETAAELQMPAMALLDRNGVYGAQRFSVAAREKRCGQLSARN